MGGLRMNILKCQIKLYAIMIIFLSFTMMKYEIKITNDKIEL